MGIFCPFCLSEHSDSNRKCLQTGKEIPQSYEKALQRGALIYPIAVIGYKGCGKTTYLSSLIYALYNKLPNDWISLLVLNQSTLDKIEKSYIPTLRKGFFPPPTSKFFEEPLIIKVNYSLTKLGLLKLKREAILIFYDTMGGNYDSVDSIKDNFPLIKNIPNIIVLVDLYSMHFSSDGIPADMKLHSLINKLTLALDELGSSSKEKNLIVNFTKIDRFWDMGKDKEDFELLTQLPSDYDSEMSFIRFYKKVILERNYSLFRFIKRKYNNFFEIIDNEYGGYSFFTSSSVGSKPSEKDNTFQVYNPLGVVDPLLWMLCID